LITVFVIFNLVENISEGLVDLPTFPFRTMLLLFIFPVIFAGLTMLTARVTVLRELGRMV
ncbi:MAG: hypothetical protein P8P98_02255, partial [Emcibacteraceae bacterium]|nr:hypothetical protein [Emcibacteraceae bacterium]